MSRIRNTAVFLSLLLIVAYIGRVSVRKPQQIEDFQDARLTVRETTIGVEIADYQEAWDQGLSGRESLDDLSGMLFIYPERRRLSFWMKEMRFPLDIVFIRDGRVTEVYEHVPAPQAGQDGRAIQAHSSGTVDMVLEVNAGWAEKYNVQVGDPIKIDIN